LFLTITSLTAQDILNSVRHGEYEKIKQLLEKDASLVKETDEWGIDFPPKKEGDNHAKSICYPITDESNTHFKHRC
jgi:hypothetical protein